MSAFLWGVATGAHQTEGNNLASDWWAIEHEPRSFVKEPSGDAVDSFHRWREDMDLAAGAGFTDYRFGVEWSRVEPVEGFFSRAAIDHYRRMVEGARARGLRPFVTLHHFTVPLWFAATGGWFRTDATEKYLRYVEAIEPVPTDSVEHVGTINEPNIVAMLARRKEGEAPGLSRGLPLPDPRVTDALIDVHHTTRAKLKAAHPHLRSAGASLCRTANRNRARSRSSRRMCIRVTRSLRKRLAVITGWGCRPTRASGSASRTVGLSRSPATAQRHSPAGSTTQTP